MAEDMEYALSCMICMELYKDPMLLPCLHTLCKTCLNKLRTPPNDKPKKPPKKIQCPQCRRELNLEDLKNVKKNFQLASIVEIYKSEMKRRLQLEAEQQKQQQKLAKEQTQSDTQPQTPQGKPEEEQQLLTLNQVSHLQQPMLPSGSKQGFLNFLRKTLQPKPQGLLSPTANPSQNIRSPRAQSPPDPVLRAESFTEQIEFRNMQQQSELVKQFQELQKQKDQSPKSSNASPPRPPPLRSNHPYILSLNTNDSISGSGITPPVSSIPVSQSIQNGLVSNEATTSANLFPSSEEFGAHALPNDTQVVPSLNDPAQVVPSSNENDAQTSLLIDFDPLSSQNSGAGTPASGAQVRNDQSANLTVLNELSVGVVTPPDLPTSVPEETYQNEPSLGVTVSSSVTSVTETSLVNAETSTIPVAAATGTSIFAEVAASCLTCDRVPPSSASIHCSTCGMSFCGECLSIYHPYTDMMSHGVKPIKEIQVTEMCILCEKEKWVVYCMECQMLFCQGCQTGHHPNNLNHWLYKQAVISSGVNNPTLPLQTPNNVPTSTVLTPVDDRPPLPPIRPNNVPTSTALSPVAERPPLPPLRPSNVPSSTVLTPAAERPPLPPLRPSNMPTSTADERPPLPPPRPNSTPTTPVDDRPPLPPPRPNSVPRAASMEESPVENRPLLPLRPNSIASSLGEQTIEEEPTAPEYISTSELVKCPVCTKSLVCVRCLDCEEDLCGACATRRHQSDYARSHTFVKLLESHLKKIVKAEKKMEEVEKLIQAGLLELMLLKQALMSELASKVPGPL